MRPSELVTTAHLERKAIIYIRQSTPQQVLSNQESLRLQYALKQRAVDLGWRDEAIDIIDADLGLTGASAQQRAGFKEVIAQVTLGQVGIILSSEVTRLSRNCSDWKPFSRNTLKNGFNGDPPDPSGPSSARAVIAGTGIREGGEGNPH
jgi:hypothetical protein